MYIMCLFVFFSGQCMHMCLFVSFSGLDCYFISYIEILSDGPRELPDCCACKCVGVYWQ